ncbi:DUF4870 domain-containing protein [Dysgonomonas sp. Marseille-P4677]|uniref:DUF4870 domain-containing protein n=1 Tax=Dysgonomonas sp. Marseille-P4677 TaxID=2364790 RepID=UPI0019112B88|nr:DUF4870 domain-containing protein [Dysgonomonas sp. Marseille-P4677]MBK5722657.1 DUF4870 domain-containing protein [Dysgonomonas sp. Marseille-P4677]
MDKYDELKRLEELRIQGSISEEEFQREKAKILNSDNNQNNGRGLGGINENTYITLMHLSQFAGILIPGLGFILPIVLWLVNAKEYSNVDMHGKNIANFMISMLIYITVAGILCITIIGLVIGLPMLIVIGILQLVFVIIAAVKASNGEYWKYPLSITFFS